MMMNIYRESIRLSRGAVNGAESATTNNTFDVVCSHQLCFRTCIITITFSIQTVSCYIIIVTIHRVAVDDGDGVLQLLTAHCYRRSSVVLNAQPIYNQTVTIIKRSLSLLDKVLSSTDRHSVAQSQLWDLIANSHMVTRVHGLPITEQTALSVQALLSVKGRGV